jgi:sugar lactone lactonase YvrE
VPSAICFKNQLNAPTALYTDDSTNQRSVRLGRWVAAAVCALAMLMAGVSAVAQLPVAAVQFLGVPTPAFSGFEEPFGLAVDANGNVYIADYDANAVYEETLQNDGSYVQSTVAIDLTDSPVALAVDAAGNVYIGLDAGSETSSLVKETLQGNGAYLASTIGTGLEQVYGIAVDGSGNVYTADNTDGGEVHKFVPADNTYTGTVIFSQEDPVSGLAIDASGNLYVETILDNEIFKLAPNGNPVTSTSYGSTVLSGVAISGYGIAVDGSGDLYLEDQGGDLYLETSTGDTSYTQTALVSGNYYGLGVAIAPTGAVYFGEGGIVDTFSPGAVNLGTLATQTASGPFTLTYTIQASTVVGAIKVTNQGANSTQSGSPEFAVAEGGSCVVQTYGSLTTCTQPVTFTPQYPGLRTGAVQFLDGGGNVLSTVYLYGIGQAPRAAFSNATAQAANITGLGETALNGPIGPVFDAMGNLYFADSSNNRIVEVSPQGVATILGTPDITLSNPNGVAIDGAGNLFIADSGNARVVELTAQGTASVLNTGAVSLGNNYGVAVDGLGNVYTTDYLDNDVVIFPSGGQPRVLTTTGVTLGSPLGVAADGAGNVYIADTQNSQIVKVNHGVGTVLSVGSLTPPLQNPLGVAVDAVGNVLISDSGNNRLVELPAQGGDARVVSTGTVPLSSPDSAAEDNLGDVVILNEDSNLLAVVNQGTAMALSFSAPAVQQSTTLVNLGNAPLTFAQPEVGQNPSFGTADFSIVSANSGGYCGLVSGDSPSYSLQAGTACVLDIQFTPGTDSGTITDTLTIADNSLGAINATQTIALTGMALPAPTVTLIPTPPSPIVYGQIATALGATVSYTSGVPTGQVSFTDNDASLAAPSTLNDEMAGLPARYYLAGSHSFKASYLGSESFNPASSLSIPYQVNRATTALNGPSGTVLVPVGTNGFVAVTVTGQYAGEGVLTPTGRVCYRITNSSNTEVAGDMLTIEAGQVSIPVGNTLPTGLYSVALTYSGDANYLAAPAATLALRIGTVATSITWTQPTPITYGTALAGSLNASAFNGDSVVPGSFTYTATREGGAAVPVSGATILGAGSYMLTATFTPTNAQLYAPATLTVALVVGKAMPVAAWHAPSAIAYGTALGELLNASATFNHAAVPGSFTYTAMATGGNAAAVTASTVLAAGSYHLTATFAVTDTVDFLTGETATVALTIADSATTTSLSSSENPQLYLNGTTLTATIASIAGTPTGIVTFLDGTTPIGSSPLANGVAAFPVTILTVGSHALTAVYGGDSNFASSTSTALTETIIDFTTTTGGTGAGSGVSTSGSSKTVVPGGSAVYALSIVPTAGEVFSVPTVLTLTGLPDGATATIAPATWVKTAPFSWTYPADTKFTDVALTITVPALTAHNEQNSPLGRTTAPLMLGLLLIPFAGAMRRGRRQLGRAIGAVLMLVAGCSVVVGVSGCASSNGFFSHATQNYTITEKVTAGALSHSTHITLTVE